MFNNTNKTVVSKRKQNSGTLLRWWFCSSSAVGLSLSLIAAHYCLPTAGFSSLPGNHWNQIQVLIIIHLPTDSPLVSDHALPPSAFRLPRPPSPQRCFVIRSCFPTKDQRCMRAVRWFNRIHGLICPPTVYDWRMSL